MQPLFAAGIHEFPTPYATTHTRGSHVAAMGPIALMRSLWTFAHSRRMGSPGGSVWVLSRHPKPNRSQPLCGPQCVHELGASSEKSQPLHKKNIIDVSQMSASLDLRGSGCQLVSAPARLWRIDFGFGSAAGSAAGLGDDVGAGFGIGLGEPYALRGEARACAAQSPGGRRKEKSRKKE